MAVSYKKLWKLLIDKDIKKKDLSAKAGVSPATITKMGKGGHVTTEVLVKICAALDCRVEDIMEIISGEAADYFSGQKTVEAVMEIIQSRMDIFISENR